MTATPEYLNKYGTPKTPEDLLQYNCLIYKADPAQNSWPFQIQKNMKIVTVDGNLTTTNSSIIKASLLANQGIARLPEYVVTKEILEKKLTVLFSKNMKIEMPLYAIYSSNRNIPPKIKCFIKFLQENISAHCDVV